jgi:Glycosyl hydrolase family 115/Gylcosyl hydrolase family 115 C-terminal domain
MLIITMAAPHLRKRILLYFLFSLQLIAKASDFPVVTPAHKVTIVYDEKAPAIDSIAAFFLAQDIERVTGFLPKITTALSETKDNVIVVGNIQSDLVQKFISKQAAFYKDLAGRWECFGLKTIDHPLKNISKAFIIAGSDSRGTAYGVFSISEKIGVSPWYWWADVPVKKTNELYLDQSEFISKPPSVKYRGIFINDEDWGLRPWAANTFEPEKKNIGPKTYAKVFELLLRLKANLLWPAMHPGTEPFYTDPANKELAAKFSIVIGSSHAEPMMRNNVGEWDEKTMGPFNYITNKEKVYTYWEDRVKQTSTNEVMYTLGMRGVHDSQMEGVKDLKEAVPLLETIIGDQRKLLENYVNKNVTNIPQAFIAYKEVLDIYDNGLKIPDDITLVWPDDNYGYIQRLSNWQEQKRSGGSGVYYHASYWGRPHDYLWLSTTHPSLIREEMIKAYENGADQLWVLNVGDIKPLEYNIQFFMDMAYDVSPYRESSYTKKHLVSWYRKIFGEKANAITNLLWQYYNLAFERRPEFVGWSQTEPTTKTNYTAYNHFYYGDEAQRRIDHYDSLQKAVVRIRKQMDAVHADAFYELVYYPVVSASLMNKKFLYRDKAWLYSKQNRISAFDYALLSRQVYDSIEQETAYFNDELKNGKWKYMMSMKPRELPVFQEPVLPSIRLQKDGGWGIASEGEDTVLDEKKLPSFTKGFQQNYFIDIFLTDSSGMEWKAKPSNDWIILSSSVGKLYPEQNKNQLRLWVSIDWSKISDSEHSIGKIFFEAAGQQKTIQVDAFQPKAVEASRFKGFAENNGYVSIFAQHFTKKQNTAHSDWKLTDGLGHTGRSFTSAVDQPVSDTDASFIKKNAAWLAYDFYIYHEDSAQAIIYTLPTHPLNDSYSMRYAITIDDGPLQLMDFRTFGRSEEWKQNVLSNTAIKKSSTFYLKKGKHTIKLFAIDPGVILDRLLIDLGGIKNGYGAVPETIKF